MTMAFKSWLPDEALRSGAVERMLRDTANAWSEAWFARQLIRLIETAGHPSERPATDSDWTCRSHSGGIGVATGGSAKLALAGLILDTSIEAGALRPADRLLLDRLAMRCIEDLCQRLSDVFGYDGTWQDDIRLAQVQDGHFYRLGPTAGTPLVQVGIDTAAAVALIKGQAATAEALAPLQSIQAALRHQPVLLSARLGQCEVALAELAGLEAGDVLVLDRNLDHPAELAVEGKSSPGRCNVTPAGDKLQLTILKPLSG